MSQRSRQTKVDRDRVEAIYSLVEADEALDNFLMSKVLDAFGIELPKDEEDLADSEDVDRVLIQIARFAHQVAEQEVRSGTKFSDEEAKTRLRVFADELSRHYSNGRILS